MPGEPTYSILNFYSQWSSHQPSSSPTVHARTPTAVNLLFQFIGLSCCPQWSFLITVHECLPPPCRQMVVSSQGATGTG